MEIFSFGTLVVFLVGLFGYVWKLRNQITTLIPGQKDEKIVDTVEGLCEEYGVDIDEIAKKSRGRLKKQLFNK